MNKKSITPAPELDAISTEILWTRIISIVDEAAKVIARTAFSTLSNEANDFSCVITDAQGRSLAQNTYGIPSFIGMLPATVRHVCAEIDVDDMQEGDVFITNDPWKGSGHLPDVCLVKPLFRDGRIVAFAATVSHVPDIGGAVRNMSVREVFEEGLYLPIIRFMRAGEADKLLVRLITANVRTPEQTIGDIWAQVAALEVMNARLSAMLDEYGLTDLAALSDQVLERAERAMRTAIEALPNGTTYCEFTSDGFDIPFEFKIALTIRDGEIIADYTGTSKQQPRAINCPLTYTKAMTAFAIKAVLLPDLPNNDGMYRPIKVIAEEGSLLNPMRPAAVGARAATGHYVPPLIFGALHQVVPKAVMAPSGSPLWAVTLTGQRNEGEGRFASVMFFNGGAGARPDADGISCLSWPSNISSTPIEVAERNDPVYFVHKRLVDGSGGSGQYRGGLGQDIGIRLEAESGTSAFFMVERIVHAAPGMGGGEEGARGQVLVNDVEIDARQPQHLLLNDTIRLITPGAGGYGPAADRAAHLKERDRELGYESN